jgi:hypothetical protein
MDDDSVSLTIEGSMRELTQGLGVLEDFDGLEN